MKDHFDKIPTEAQLKIGYGVAGGLTTTPIWVKALTEWLQLGVVAVGLVIGLTTLYLNISKIIDKKKKRG